MKVKVKGYEGLLIELKRKWTHEYEWATSRYEVDIMIDKNTTVFLSGIKPEEIEFVEE